MKKLLLIAALLLICSTVFSQKKTQFGVKGGLNVTNMYNFDADYKPSIYAGLFANVKISNRLGIQPEVVYSRQGATTDNEGTKGWFKMDYINIPLMLKIYFGIERKVSFDVGPQVGFLVNSKIKIKSDGSSATVNIKDLGASPEDIDFSVALGLTLFITQKIDISFRGNIGVTKMFSVPRFEGDKSVYNHVFQLGVEYRF